MFTRSRAHIFVRTPDSDVVVSALDRHLRRWDYGRVDSIPAGYAGRRGREVREIYHRSGSPWSTLAVEDLSELLATAYALCKALPGTCVLASRAYKYGEWQLKVYEDRDCILKVGDDPDHELAWVGRPLDEERLPEVAGKLGGGAAIEAFLRDVIAGRPRPEGLSASLGLPPLSVGFPELAADASVREGWTYAAWVHADSPLRRGQP